MADIADVEQAIADTVAGILYPEGLAAGSVIGATCRIYRGWPNSATLNADLSTGVVNVTVAAENDSGRVTTRYWNEWHLAQGQPELAATVRNGSIVIQGTASDGLLVGALVDGAPFCCRASADDTVALVAANLCAAIQVGRPAVLSEAAIALPGAFRITARVAAEAILSYEDRRQEKDVRVIFWCPSPSVRDAVAAAVDALMARFHFLSLIDGSSARITYVNSTAYDQTQNALLYRRDLLYRVEYATMTSELLPAMLFGAAGINDNTTYG